MATTVSEDGSKKERKNTNRGHVAWSFPGKSEKETDLEKVIKTKKTKKQTIDDILNSINQ